MNQVPIFATINSHVYFACLNPQMPFAPINEEISCAPKNEEMSCNAIKSLELNRGNLPKREENKQILSSKTPYVYVIGVKYGWYEKRHGWYEIIFPIYV